MDVPNRQKDPTISDTVIMKRPGLWESVRGDDEVGHDVSTATEARPVVPVSPDKSQ